MMMYPMWSTVPGGMSSPDEQWFFSIFHAVSAFCNAGFSLCTNSLESFHGAWGVYLVIVPLILIGGLGFGVLYNISHVLWHRFWKMIRQQSCPERCFQMGQPVRLAASKQDRSGEQCIAGAGRNGDDIVLRAFFH